MHPEATDFVIRAIQDYGPFDRVLEVGSRDVNGTIKQEFMSRGTTHYVGMDLEPGPNVDVVIDFSNAWAVTEVTSTTWCEVGTFITGSDRYDAVVCVNVLEHTPEGEAIFRNAYRALHADGIFIMSAANTWIPHGSFDGGMVMPGEHYANVTEEEVVEWAMKAGFGMFERNIKMHDIQFLGWK